MELKAYEIAALIKIQIDVQEPSVDRIIALAHELKAALEREDNAKRGCA